MPAEGVEKRRSAIFSFSSVSHLYKPPLLSNYNFIKMKRVLFILVCAAMMAQAIVAEKRDSVRIVSLDEVVVNALRASHNTPMAVTNVGKAQIQRTNVCQDLPYLLGQTPSVTVTSDNGLGIGTTYFRVRGSDNSRVNFTVDGVPINDSEDQSVFWANMNSFAAGLESIQIQRGVGTSTNGAGAFGATVSMKSAASHLSPYVWANGSYGSYNTYKYDVLGGTGLLYNHFTFDARYSQTYTDGFIDRTAGHLRTYSFTGTYFGDNFLIRYRNFGSGECVQQCWNGVTPDEMQQYGRRYNSLGKYTDDNGNTAFRPTTDNYWQNHNYLSFIKDFSSAWKMNLTLHFTHGHGYYDDLKSNASLYKFGLSNFIDASGNKVKKTDLIRNKALKNDFGGGIFNLNYKSNKIDAVFGAAANHFDGDHWGEVTWARNYPDLTYGKHYYDSNAKKTDYNFFVKANYQFSTPFSAYVDLQYRGVDYKITGMNDKFYTDADWNNVQQSLNVDRHWNFFNPKAGINYEQGGNRAYASFAVAHREPTRNNYTDNGQFDPAPSAESLRDYELGYVYSARIWNVGVNLYYMDYSDQLVLSGQTSDIGEALTVNVPDSYRMGVELTAAVRPCNWFNWNANLTLSRNKIKNFTETLTTYDKDWNEISPTVTNYGSTDISFAPKVIANNCFNFIYKNFTASALTNFVGRQYLDNTQSRSRSLDSYTTTSLRLDYTFRPSFCKELTLGFNVYNLFNAKYESNGGAGGDVEYDESSKSEQKVYWTWLFPQAGTTCMGTVSIKF
jgi:iron complex outermembrane receptor protein